MTSLLNTARKKIYAALGMLLVLILFNLSNGRAIKLEEVRFEDWLQNNNLLLTKEGSYIAPQEEIVVELLAKLPEQRNLQFQISTAKSPDQVQRLLNLVKEARLFKDGRREDPQAMQLRIRQGSREFATGINADLVERNLQARTLVKLFEIYAKQNQS